MVVAEVVVVEDKWREGGRTRRRSRRKQWSAEEECCYIFHSPSAFISVFVRMVVPDVQGMTTD